jgi:hypothetical protein
MGQLFYGSIDLTLLIEEAKKKHSAFTKGNNGKIYASVNIWLNDKEDKFGNIMSVQISPSKQMKDVEKRIYIGNLKESEGPKPISNRDTSGLDVDLDIPERVSGPREGEAGIDTEIPF